MHIVLFSQVKKYYASMDHYYTRPRLLADKLKKNTLNILFTTMDGIKSNASQILFLCFSSCSKFTVEFNCQFFSWDEWVPETRVLKFNESNLQKQKELIKAHNLQ